MSLLNWILIIALALILAGVAELIRKHRPPTWRIRKMEKGKGLATRKLTSPKREAETKRQLDSKPEKLDSKAAELLLNFVHGYSKNLITTDATATLWEFLGYLKKKGHHIIDERTVYCLPFSHLVCYKSLK